MLDNIEDKPVSGGVGLPSVRGLPLNPLAVIALVILVDVASAVGFYILSYSQADVAGVGPARIWRITDLVFCASIPYFLLMSGGYRQSQLANMFSQISRILVTACSVVLIEWIALWLTDQLREFDWPYEGPLNLVSGAVLVMCASRMITHQLLRASAQRGMLVRSVAIVGGGIHGARLLEALNRRKEPWTRIVGVFDDRKNRLDTLSSDLTVVGDLDQLIDFARSERVDDILVALPWGAESRLLALFDKLKVIPANIRLAPDVISHHFLDQGFSWVDGVPVFNVFGKPISGWGALLKRCEDLILGSILLFMVAPVMVACAVAVRLDSPGPILFKQNRYGYNNKLIGVYKFRSMYHHMRDESAARLATKDDPRITRIGAFLRRTSLDELPQLLNVVLGDMSLVGPRPHATQARAAGHLYQEVVREYAVRHKVKPGITGWAQVMGWRGETDTEEKIIRRVECDLYYMERWSLFLDIEILFRTAFVVVGKNVY